MKNFLLGILVSLMMLSLFIEKFVYIPTLKELQSLEKDCNYNEKEYFFWGCVEATSGETELCRDMTKEKLE